MPSYSLDAEERVILGKKSKHLSAEGKFPAVVYGKGIETSSISLNLKAFTKVLASAGHTNIIELVLTSSDKTEQRLPVLCWDIKRHPVKNTIQHVDLYKVDMKEEVTVRIPLILVGTSKGVKLGGKLEVYREYLDITALPENLIKEIIVDITNIDINTIFYLEEIQVPSNVKIVYDKNIAIFSVKLNEAREEEATK